MSDARGVYEALKSLPPEEIKKIPEQTRIGTICAILLSDLGEMAMTLQCSPSNLYMIPHGLGAMLIDTLDKVLADAQKDKEKSGQEDMAKVAEQILKQMEKDNGSTPGSDQ